MSMPFDATLKDLAREEPGAFLTTFDRPPAGPVSPLNVDLSTVTTAADVALGVGDPLTEIIHLDFQSSASADKDADLLVYNSLLYRHYRLPVHTMIVLLRSQAAHSDMTGTVAYSARPGRSKMDFGYEIIPLWQRPAEDLLAGDLGTVPLALLGRLPEGVELVEGLTGVAERVLQRLEHEAPPERFRKLATAAWLLTGLRVRRDVALGIFRGVRAMHDSDTYMAIIDEGREIEARKWLLFQGEERFGSPSESVRTRVVGITDLDRLERLGKRLLKASTWEDLLDTP
jgi:hypothetical protein